MYGAVAVEVKLSGDLRRSLFMNGYVLRLEKLLVDLLSLFFLSLFFNFFSFGIKRYIVLSEQLFKK